MKKPRIIAIVGPTASGKTALAVSLARRLDGEIISCDSMQVYRKMNIGTAKPTAEEMGGIPHHLLDIVEPDQTFTVADYTEAAEVAARDILSRGKLPIFCGGTGLYFDSFLRGGFAPMQLDAEYRAALDRLLSEIGAEGMHARLAEVDAESAAAIHPNNVRRVIHALEVYHATGITKSEHDRRSRENECPYDVKMILLGFADRETLYSRIDRRVDKMLEDGLWEEVAELDADGVFERSRTASQAIGYKELLGAIRGEQPRAEAIELLKRSTRRYAKRQLTWFGAKDDAYRLMLDGKSAEQILCEAEKICTE